MPEGLDYTPNDVYKGDFDDIHTLQNEIRNESSESLEKIESTPVVDDHEHVVDINNPEIQQRIEESKGLFAEFVRDFGEKVDLSNENTVADVYSEAEKRGIFEQAKSIRELIFGKNISVYGVCYVSNMCSEYCPYCPIAEANKAVKLIVDEQGGLMNHLEKHPEDEASRERLKYLTEVALPEASKKIKGLSFVMNNPEERSELEQDLNAIGEIGHNEVCILAGEEIGMDPDSVAQCAIIAAKAPGIKEVVINMGSYGQSTFEYINKKVKTEVPTVKLQHRVFQETYQEDEYIEIHKETTAKKDFQYRYESQVRAINAGIDEVGIGVQIGLTKFPLKEIYGMQQHSEFIKSQTGKEVKRAAMPFTNRPQESKVKIPFEVGKFSTDNKNKMIELAYALARLAMPTVSIVSSERDRPEMLERLDPYGNHTTLDVQDEPGANIEELQRLKGTEVIHQELAPQAETFPRKPKDAIISWKERGYRIFGFDWKKYVDAETE
jgi:2-iminoacetate synthase ThiH